MSDAAQTGARLGPADLVNAFMCIGDSITIGFPTDLGGYRNKLLALCPTMAFTGRNINGGSPALYHEGYNGFRTDQVLPLVQPIIRILQPRCLLVTMGVNDINQGETPAATLTEVRAFAETLLAESPYVTHVIVSSIPIGSTLHGLGGEAFNTGLVAAFAGCDSRITTVDTASSLVFGTADFTDGLHPSEIGYQTMANNWATYLHTLFPTL